MTLEFFYNNYDISDIEIKKLYIKNNQLFLVGKYNVYLELIANGYRPEMNMDVDKTFVFNVSHENHNFTKINNAKIIKKDNNYFIVINDIEIELSGNVDII